MPLRCQEGVPFFLRLRRHSEIISFQRSKHVKAVQLNRVDFAGSQSRHLELKLVAVDFEAEGTEWRAAGRAEGDNEEGKVAQGARSAARGGKEAARGVGHGSRRRRGPSGRRGCARRLSNTVMAAPMCSWPICTVGGKTKGRRTWVIKVSVLITRVEEVVARERELGRDGRVGRDDGTGKGARRVRARRGGYEGRGEEGGEWCDGEVESGCRECVRSSRGGRVGKECRG
ncbi:hypothetical protein DFH09DRAFT_1079264 [Mycena vulgaris]|nr:hypothetical protein DFH09DRAFT_1079264 [Mycena vulgaris]